MTPSGFCDTSTPAEAAEPSGMAREPTSELTRLSPRPEKEAVAPETEPNVDEVALRGFLELLHLLLTKQSNSRQVPGI